MVTLKTISTGPFSLPAVTTERSAAIEVETLSLSLICAVAEGVDNEIAGSEGLETVAIILSVFSNKLSSITGTVIVPTSLPKGTVILCPIKPE